MNKIFFTIMFFITNTSILLYDLFRSYGPYKVSPLLKLFQLTHLTLLADCIYWFLTVLSDASLIYKAEVERKQKGAERKHWRTFISTGLDVFYQIMLVFSLFVFILYWTLYVIHPDNVSDPRFRPYCYLWLNMFLHGGSALCLVIDQFIHNHVQYKQKFVQDCVIIGIVVVVYINMLGVFKKIMGEDVYGFQEKLTFNLKVVVYSVFSSFCIMLDVAYRKICKWCNSKEEKNLV
jgi:magnesium-transporting ATPase (P-type)